MRSRDDMKTKIKEGPNAVCMSLLLIAVTELGYKTQLAVVALA